MENEIYTVEFKRIEENNITTLEEYLRLNRAGSTIQLNRKQRKEIFTAYTYNIEIKSLYEMRCNDLFNTNKNRGLSRNGMVAYNAICKHRDEVMLIDA